MELKFHHQSFQRIFRTDLLKDGLVVKTFLHMFTYAFNKLGIKIAGRNTNHLRYTDDTTLMAESEEEVKRLLMKVNKE